MTIEIRSPHLKPGKKILAVIEKKVLTLAHLSEKVSRAEIFLETDNPLIRENKVCKIRLDIFGDTIFVHKKAKSFEEAATSAVRVLKKRLKRKKENRNEPPDEITSTVEV